MTAQLALKNMRKLLPEAAEVVKKRARSALTKKSKKSRAAVAEAVMQLAQVAPTMHMKTRNMMSLPVQAVEAGRNNSAVALQMKTTKNRLM